MPAEPYSGEFRRESARRNTSEKIDGANFHRCGKDVENKDLEIFLRP
jgi:hypothetical protein